MPKHFWATLFLRTVLPSRDADVMLGDLLEISGLEKINFRTLLRETVWTLGWRNLVGYAAAVIGGLAMIYVQRDFLSTLTWRDLVPWQQNLGSALAFLAGSMAFMLCFSVARYGIRDRMTLIAFGCSLPGIAAIVFWLTPSVPVIAGASLFLAAALSLTWERDWRTVITLVIVTFLQPVVWFGGLALLIAPVRLLLEHWHTRSINVAPFVMIWLSLTYLGLAVVACKMCTTTHRWICKHGTAVSA